MKTYLYRASNLKSTITFLAFVSYGSQVLVPAKNHQFLQFIHQRMLTLYVGLAHAVPPINTNFRLTVLLTQLQEAVYEDYQIEHQI